MRWALVALLALLAAALVWPVPGRLAASRTAIRHPALALLAWQAIGAATGLAVIGALLAYAWAGGPLGAVARVTAAGLVGYLLAATATVTVRTLIRRRRHRELLDLVGTPLPALPGGRLLESRIATAYCLPGRRPRTVLTSAVLSRLGPDALDAVVAHERAHLDQRHDLVVLPFVAWKAALPFLPGARTARRAVALLVEALADDTAHALVGNAALADALRTVYLAGAPTEAAADDPAPGTHVRIRLARLESVGGAR